MLYYISPSYCSLIKPNNHVMEFMVLIKRASNHVFNCFSTALCLLYRNHLNQVIKLLHG